MEQKKELRRRMLEIRLNMPEPLRERESAEICRRLTESDVYRAADSVLFYMPFRGEVDVKPAILHAWQSGKTVLLPRVQTATRRMRAFRVNGWDDLEKGAYGIPEPKEDPDGMWPPERIDLVVTPGVAFDRKGYRLGYGGGYYDRFLQGLNHPVRIGVCFREQMVDTVFPEPHDQRMRWIVTPDDWLTIDG
ncbi:5-formyltetrahydrofolate cyclo-ligase [Staphylospora marina]|uniref:5-formyltetrahydrofolate cyclo-ligase n=1 Tax=Staphylospora marina TaxID=2490858 RepID=UPI000F5BA00A|nr:5-formyltetrahydrofolate cyclo-ligase [Staphylospora marina]